MLRFGTGVKAGGHPVTRSRDDGTGHQRLPSNAWVHSQADTPGSIWVVIRESDLSSGAAHRIAAMKCEVRFRHEIRQAYAIGSYKDHVTDEYLLALGPVLREVKDGPGSA